MEQILEHADDKAPSFVVFCDNESATSVMVSRAPTVRVRQRALQKPPHTRLLFSESTCRFWNAAPVVEIFDRYLAGWGFKEIANHLNRPGGPAPPRHVDSQRNTAGKWSKTTIRAILENPVYTGRLYWNRLDFRAAKLGEGSVLRRSEEEWVRAERRHEAVIPDAW